MDIEMFAVADYDHTFQGHLIKLIQ